MRFAAPRSSQLERPLRVTAYTSTLPFSGCVAVFTLQYLRSVPSFTVSLNCRSPRLDCLSAAALVDRYSNLVASVPIGSRFLEYDLRTRTVVTNLLKIIAG
jgi:hypothetical protein